ncbi:unnamed protein product [Prorocentrum cordatum]|uniref:BHLH domain-containing protein n=1 Tax=Prorocentrum cordatum TaxID=2364126 RepID=A0ABN9UFP5_9DINO|nr:unnamed protein product [Polarella glacialis]
MSDETHVPPPPFNLTSAWHHDPLANDCHCALPALLALKAGGQRFEVLDQSSDLSSSQAWTAWSGQSHSQDDGRELAFGAGGQAAVEPAHGHHWVWDSSHSRSCSSSRTGGRSSQSRSSLCDAVPARRALEAHGAADLPSFNDRADFPEYIPGADSPCDRGSMLLLPGSSRPLASRSAKRRRERKNNEKRRDMRAHNEVMLQRVFEALGSLSPRTLEARRRQLPSASPRERAASPVVPPPTPRWKVDRVQRPGEEDDADSQCSYGDR